jgi:hypothetical protein
MTTGTQSEIEPRRRSSHLRSDQVIEIVIAKGKRSNGTPHPFLFDCWFENSARLLCTSRQPFLDAARALLALGCQPNAILVMRHAGSSVEALRASLQVAARLTVDECNGTRFARWKSFSNSVGSTRREESGSPRDDGVQPESGSSSGRSVAARADQNFKIVDVSAKAFFDCRSGHLRGVTQKN